MRRTFGTWSLGPIQSGTAPFGRTLAEIVAHERASRDASEPYRRVVAHELEQVMSRVLQRLAPPPAALAAHAAQARSAQDDVDERFTRMPRGSADWVSLYEVDGDWILADIERNETVWLGGEWTGDRITRFDLPWTRAAAFVLWRVLDGGYVRPTDLQMLAR
jgi:hypothetical protein